MPPRPPTLPGANPTPNPTLTLTLTRPGLGVLTSATYVGYSRRLLTSATYCGDLRLCVRYLGVCATWEVPYLSLTAGA